MQRKGYVSWWTDQQIIPGDDWRTAIGDNLDEANIILLLISIHFLSSDFCWEVELARAIERHRKGEARVIPVFVRSCRWQQTPIEGLQGVPNNGRPLQKWPDKHEAWTSVALGIEKAVTEWRKLRIVGVPNA